MTDPWPEPKWHWRNCREIGISLQFWLTSWSFGFYRHADVYGGEWHLSAGPVGIVLHANIGNVSSENRFKAWLGLSCEEAWSRAVRYERLRQIEEADHA